MLLVIIPFLLFFTLAFSDLLGFWLPNANQIIVIATLCIASTYLIGTLAVPPYYFLMSRHHVRKTVWLQLSNVVVNGVVILATYQSWGLYGVVIANSLAITSSLGLSMYFQKKYLGPFRIDSDLVRRLWLTVPVVGAVAVLTSSLLTEPMLRIATAGICALLTYILLSRGSRPWFKPWIA